VKNQPAVIWGIIAVALIIAAAIFIFSPGKYDSFAQCLSDKGAKMYGTALCTHCKEQKDMFGKSWAYIDYVECSSPDGYGQLDICKAANITGYPTWVFDGGIRKSGTVPMEELSEKTGCSLSQ